MTEHRTGTREEWRTARVELLELEKEHARRADELARMCRELPWVRIDKPYGGMVHLHPTYVRGTIPAGEWWWRRHDEYEEE